MSIRDRIAKFRKEYDLGRVTLAAAGVTVVALALATLDGKRRLYNAQVDSIEFDTQDRKEWKVERDMLNAQFLSTAAEKQRVA